jgi:hypothetical protein
VKSEGVGANPIREVRFIRLLIGLGGHFSDARLVHRKILNRLLGRYIQAVSAKFSLSS